MLGSDETIYRLYGEEGLRDKRKCGSLGKWIPALNRCAYGGYGGGGVVEPSPGVDPEPPQVPQPPETPVAPAEEEIAAEMRKRAKSGRNDVRVNPDGVQQMGTNMGAV